MTEYNTLEIFDVGEARERLRQATRNVLDAETAYQERAREASDAESVYRKMLADSFKRFREAGEAVQSAEIAARGECAKHSRERDYSASMLKLAGEKLEDARDSRRSLWRLIEWSRDHDTRTPASNGPAPAGTPTGLWP